jgi:hypothetical protein
VVCLRMNKLIRDAKVQPDFVFYRD